ncbi:hypothetical protein P3W85_38875 [Cupriavidus basilensis]|uniref:Lipoprotein n=1 Tax=Cupriavidus basilensis TaxID=68895 RepID=A0ABT6B2Y4_9BURK|nr:hypothetical protein [Cupriavidus basilensis]MDF3838857.1 hypothetical protein [Cupriavidus basilensis]
MKLSTFLSAATLSGSLLLAACGGGGDSGSNAAALAAVIPANTSAEGIYASDKANSSGYSTAAFVLENNEFYLIYAKSGAKGDADLGMVHGVGTARNGSFSSSGATDYNFTTLARTPATLSTGYTTKSSFNGSFSGQARTLGFAASYDKLYDTPASLSAAAGTYATASVSGSGGTAALMTIATDGTLAGSFPAGNGTCKFTGSLVPRASGKNFFNMTVAFGGAPCPLGTSATNGVAVALAQGNQTALFAASVLADGSNAFVVVGSRM